MTTAEQRTQQKTSTAADNVVEIAKARHLYTSTPFWVAETGKHDYASILSGGYDSSDLRRFVLNHAIMTGNYVRSAYYFGALKSPDSFLPSLVDVASPMSTRGKTLSAESDSLWAFSDGAMLVETESKALSVSLHAVSDERIAWFGKWIDDHFEPYVEKIVENKDGSVYMLVSSRTEGMTVKRIGKISAPFVRENYSADVIVQYDRAVADLNSDSPSGRIVILDGVPGTGKTWLVRAMTRAASCAFVFVPPAMAKEMGDPSLVPVLIETRNAHGHVALVFEDADQLLTPRNGLTMDSLATILNLGDGILGDLLDVRVICTTNSPVKEIDKALLRPGRLSARIAVNPLTSAEWHPIYTRLTGKASRAKGKKTLADVYAMAREA